MAARSRPATVSERVFVRSTATPTHDEIASRAYRLFVERGRADGHDVDDWLQAERELTGRSGDGYAAA